MPKQDAEDVLEFRDVLADGSMEGHGFQCAEDDNYIYAVAESTYIKDLTPCFEVAITTIDDGEFITHKVFATEAEAKLWAAKYSLGER